MIALALLCRDAKRLTRLESTEWCVQDGVLQESIPAQWVTGYWTMNYDKAANLIGENLILVESKATPSYIGGRITGLESVGDKIQFFFEEDPELVGRTEHTHLWRSQNPVCYLKASLR